MKLDISLVDVQRVINMCSNKEYAAALLEGTADEWLKLNYPEIGQSLITADMKIVTVIDVYPESNTIKVLDEEHWFTDKHGNRTDKRPKEDDFDTEIRHEVETYSDRKLDILLAMQEKRRHSLGIGMFSDMMKDMLPIIEKAKASAKENEFNASEKTPTAKTPEKKQSAAHPE